MLCISKLPSLVLKPSIIRTNVTSSKLSSHRGSFLDKLKLRKPSAPGGSERVTYSLFDLTLRLDFVPANGQTAAYENMDLVCEDDTYVGLIEFRVKYDLLAQLTYQGLGFNYNKEHVDWIKYKVLVS